jgi:hypothetical protein
VTDERALSDLLHGVLDRQDASGPYQRLQIELEKPGAARSHRGRRIFMTRNRMVLLAAALVVILITGLLVSTRLYQDYRNTSQIPAGHPGIDQAKLAQLLARPLGIKRITATATCPNGPEDLATSIYGGGPVYEQPGPAGSSPWGQYGNVTILTPIGINGPVVARGIDVRTGEPMVFLPPYGTGAILRTDTLNGKIQNQYTSAVLDTAHPPALRETVGSTPYVLWSWWQGISKNASVCLGYEFDGPDFSEVFYSSPGNY